MLDYAPQKDTKHKKYIPKSVYTASKERIKEIINITDDRIVMFSGGKDSLVVLNLVQEVYDELGINEKVKVAFFDEELIPDFVIDFVIDIYKSNKYDFRYYAIPLKSFKHSMGVTEGYVQWDPNREWVRQPPSFAITLNDNPEGLSQYNRDKLVCEGLEGNVAMIKGLRADEGLYRLKSCLNKPHKTYINKTEYKNIISCKPIYDWTEKDVFVYFYKNNINYNENYDKQTWNKQTLRLATPLLPEHRKEWYKLKTYDPDFYNRIVKIFPEMILQDRYGKEIQKDDNFEGYEHTIKGLNKYIEDNLTGDDKNLCKKRIATALKTRINLIQKGENKNIFASYPLRVLFMYVRNCTFKRSLFPQKPVLKDYLFEGYTEEDYINDKKQNNIKNK